jgi:hypothetical protein
MDEALDTCGLFVCISKLMRKATPCRMPWSRDELFDLINITIEELVLQCLELPAFYSIVR